MEHNNNEKRKNMSFPIIPDVIPEIDVDREDAINLLLASIAFEELGFSPYN
ncbi:hypothetical protein RBH29_16060 [Herbivorax sp. ANBcel31]|uniref:hypothetical protein n=1 Tax=Herbivorax sp. ANBcel31 TaxID=3069754 RepID=UPI0027B259C7|nr:hypothetical protein [Herbivorax sp. ANBcel31]MDQ2087944.1 hypothetical protein [Herbivorax sp. ANBcel31]